MPSHTEITAAQLSRLIGLPHAPAIVDVRTQEDFKADPRLLPTAQHRDFNTVSSWASSLAGCSVVVVCQAGLKLSQGVAAWLRHVGIQAESLEGGFDAWKAAGGPLVRTDKLPVRNEAGQIVWVTRARPKVDRIACPWLIRRFIDPNAVFLFVAASEVLMVAERFKATPFDIDGVFWSHRGERCTFDAMIEEFELKSEPLHRLATIVRALTLTGWTSCRKPPASWPPRLASRACIATTYSNWKPACCSMTPSTAGAEMRLSRRMTGRRGTSWREGRMSIAFTTERPATLLPTPPLARGDNDPSGVVIAETADRKLVAASRGLWPESCIWSYRGGIGE